MLHQRSHHEVYNKTKITVRPDKKAHTLGFGCVDVSPTSTLALPVRHSISFSALAPLVCDTSKLLTIFWFDASEQILNELQHLNIYFPTVGDADFLSGSAQIWAICWKSDVEVFVSTVARECLGATPWIF